MFKLIIMFFIYSKTTSVDNLIKCPHCSKILQNKILFNKHMCQTFNESIDKIQNQYEFNCEICSKKFLSKKRLLFHHQFHMKNGRPKICLICLIKFPDELEFFNHIMYEHEDNETFFCCHCDRTFITNDLLEKHKKIHETQRFFSCNFCNMNFIEKQTLKDHLVIHNNRKPFVCALCSKEFNKQSRLKNHLLTHEKPTKNLIPFCCVCDEAFATKDITIKHYINDHQYSVDRGKQLFSYYSGDRVYCCHFCEK